MTLSLLYIALWDALRALYNSNLFLGKRYPRSELSPYTVCKIAKDVTREIVLEISRIKMICHIENF